MTIARITSRLSCIGCAGCRTLDRHRRERGRSTDTTRHGRRLPAVSGRPPGHRRHRRVLRLLRRRLRRRQRSLLLRLGRREGARRPSDHARQAGADGAPRAHHRRRVARLARRPCRRACAPGPPGHPRAAAAHRRSLGSDRRARTRRSPRRARSRAAGRRRFDTGLAASANNTTSRAPDRVSVPHRLRGDRRAVAACPGARAACTPGRSATSPAGAVHPRHRDRFAVDRPQHDVPARVGDVAEQAAAVPPVRRRSRTPRRRTRRASPASNSASASAPAAARRRRPSGGTRSSRRYSVSSNDVGTACAGGLGTHAWLKAVAVRACSANGGQVASHGCERRGRLLRPSRRQPVDQQTPHRSSAARRPPCRRSR